ncbi:hypothetical protein GSbR_21890 [Geobacter sp. SVR]|nr:hypothetical protein GSVR_15930 [Geobacter sp. SVR]GCF85589.1 hypothetical protein GSbR_21890 [Geobacter sp. SVR]
MSRGKMDNLYFRGKVLYMKFTFMGQYVHRSTGTDDPKLAALAIKKAQKEIYEKVMQVVPEVPVVTLNKAIEDVWSERWQKNRSGLQSYNQAYVVAEILDGSTPVHTIDTKKVREIQAELRKELECAESTVNRYMAAFRTVMLHASESYNFKAPKFTLSKEPEGRIRVYSLEEEAAILGWFTQHKAYDMADLTAVLLDTGFRLSEALGIGKRNEEGKLISEMRLNLRTLSSWENKTALPRTIPMTSRVHSILSRRGDQPFHLTKGQAKDKWLPMRAALGLDEDSDRHACRHTCASRLLEAGRTLKEVQEWLGHTDIKTTQRYLHTAPHAFSQMAKCLEGVTESVTNVVLKVPPTGTAVSIKSLNVFDFNRARVAELADAPDLGSGTARYRSSSLLSRTIYFSGSSESF